MACCAIIKRCGTNHEIYLQIGDEGSSTYNFWFDLYDNGNVITIDNLSFPGIYTLINVCCTESCPECDAFIQLAPSNASVSIYNDPCPTYFTIRNCKTKQTFTVYSQAQLGLVPFLGAVVNITSVNEVIDATACWEVIDQVASETAYEVTVTKSYEDCACCLGQEPVKYTRIIPAPDRVFYKIPSQCDITTNVKFANAYYNMFKKLKYGIANDCDVDLDKITIQKELNDLAAIYDANACVITPAPVPIICPEPS